MWIGGGVQEEEVVAAVYRCSRSAANAAFAASCGTSWPSRSANHVSTWRQSRKRTPLTVASAGTSERAESHNATTGVTESG